MPELPDITIYVEALERRILGKRLVAIKVRSPFLLRTVLPPLESVEAKEVIALLRLGKRIAIGLEHGLWIVLHLMIAGRLHWKPAGAKASAKNSLATIEFSSGTLSLTEAGSKHRASLHVLEGENALRQHDPGGLEILSSSAGEFVAALRRGNHTLKRALTDPHLFSGIGNAYSDEILHRAQLSPLALSRKLSRDDAERLFRAAQVVLREWLDRLRLQSADGFPEGVTAFRPEMAVHGRFGQPCPVCGALVQRIRYADNETNYCPGCQTNRKILADRSLSRLLKDDWPRNLDEL
ncbi:MAG: Fpg/Nei family DNA glycosylase [Isosphaeraceae bacterium]